MSDSGSPGFLVPLGSPPVDDDGLLDLLQPIIVGIGGYPDGSLVRPNWQTKQTPNWPEFNLDWVAFGVALTRPDTFHYEEHIDEGDGSNAFEYSEELDLLISCFGPNSQRYSRTLRDGFRLEQNRAPLQMLDMDTLFIGDPVTIPALLHNVWVRRVDVTVTLRRVITKRYAVRTIKEGPAVDANSTLGLDNGLYVTPLRIDL